MHGCGAVQCRAAIAMVDLVELPVQPRNVKQTVQVIVQTLVAEEKCGNGHEQIWPTVIGYVHVQSMPT